MAEWQLEESEVFASRSKRCGKKRPEETRAMLNNLDTYLKALNGGAKVAQIKAGFIHGEQLGVIALDQHGAKGKPTQTRLYIYPDEDTRTVFLITVGEKGKKNIQDKAIQFCCQFVKLLRKQRGSENG